MLKRPTTAALEGFALVARLPAWAAVEAMIQAEYDEAHRVLRESGDKWALGRAQGRASFAQELLALAAKARA